MTKIAYETGSAVSADGTTIGYRQLGHGPGLLILHGGGLASQHYLKLAAALADEFTVYLPDRRGRGLSGPFGADYSIRTEDQDIAALTAATSAEYAFGTADGGLFALHASLSVRALRKLVLYEPVVFAGQPGIEEFRRVIERYDRRIEAGDLAAATVGLTKDSGAIKVLDVVPDAVLVPLAQLVFWLDAKRVRGDDVALRDLVPTLGPELAEVQATEGTLDDYRRVTADVLLLQGSKVVPLVRGSLEALHRVIPHSRIRELPGLLHGSAQDQGHPQVVAEAIRDHLRSGTAG
jgi:pimeloyl-ACP methyl ester carboxylesterase